MSKTWKVSLLVGSACIVLLCLGGYFLFETVFQIAFGWVLFLLRVVPRITIDWSATTTALVCLVVLSVGLHLFLRWLHETILQAKAADQVSRWRPRWTGMILALLVSMFVAGVSAVGFSHQLVWLFSAREPILHTSGGIRGAAALMKSASHLRQIVSATHNYHQAYNVLPPGGTFDARGNALHGWQTLLLPYLERDMLYKEIDLQKSWTDPRNAPHFRTVIDPFLHPAGGEQRNEAGYGLSHYAANVRLLGGATPRTFESITDGTSNTILAGEVAVAYKPWGHHANWRYPALGIHTSPDGFGSPVHSDSVQFLMADGSVRNVHKQVSLATLKAVSTPDGGEAIPADW